LQLCPFHDDGTPSLQIYLNADDPHYHCFGCKAHGPLSDLPEELLAPATTTPTSSAATDEQADTRRLERAHQLWAEAGPITGTLAERYLAEIRGINITTLPSSIDKALRFHPACWFNGAHHPCLIALFRDVLTDAPAGIHRTALTADAQKLGRMMLGSWPSARAIKLRSAGNELIVGEGIETTLAGNAIISTQAESALWAMGSAHAIGQLPVIMNMSALRVLVDHDTNGVGISNARRCATRWHCAGRRVALLIPERNDTDFNDLIKVGAQ
jgi:hypothetical protein